MWKRSQSEGKLFSRIKLQMWLVPASFPMFIDNCVIEKWQCSIFFHKFFTAFSWRTSSPASKSAHDFPDNSFTFLPYNCSANSKWSCCFGDRLSRDTKWHRYVCSADEMHSFLVRAASSSKKGGKKRTIVRNEATRHSGLGAKCTWRCFGLKSHHDYWQLNPPTNYGWYRWTLKMQTLNTIISLFTWSWESRNLIGYGTGQNFPIS